MISWNFENSWTEEQSFAILKRIGISWSFNVVEFVYTLFWLKMMLIELQLFQDDFDYDQLVMYKNRAVNLTRLSIIVFVLFLVVHGLS